jgi:hypothetical protein
VLARGFCGEGRKWKLVCRWVVGYLSRQFTKWMRGNLGSNKWDEEALADR